MTIREAISAELIPFSVDINTIAKACVDIDLDDTANYAASDKGNVARAAVGILNRMLILTNESEGGFTQGYSTAAIRERIASLIRDNSLTDIATSGPTITDKSSAW